MPSTDVFSITFIFYILLPLFSIAFTLLNLIDAIVVTNSDDTKSIGYFYRMHFDLFSAFKIAHLIW